MGFAATKTSKGETDLFVSPFDAKPLKVKTTFESLLDGTIPMQPLTAFPSDFLQHEDYQVYTDMDNETYHSKKEFDSSSRIKQIFNSELHYTNYTGGDPTSSMNLGTCIHMLFEDIINNDCKDLESCLELWTPTTTKTTCDPINRKIGTDGMAVLTGLIQEIERMELVPLLKKCFSEVSLFTEYDEGGEEIKQRIRPDIWLPLPNMPFDYMISIKSVLNLAKFKYQIKDFGYDLSEGMYNFHMERAFQKPFRTCFLLVDTQNNGMIQVLEIDEPTMEQYSEKYDTAMNKISKIDPNKPKGYGIGMV